MFYFGASYVIIIVIAFLRKKSFFLIITFKSIAFICDNFLKISDFKKNLKTTSNEKLLIASSQKIDFIGGERK